MGNREGTATTDARCLCCKVVHAAQDQDLCKHPQLHNAVLTKRALDDFYAGREPLFAHRANTHPSVLVRCRGILQEGVHSKQVRVLLLRNSQLNAQPPRAQRHKQSVAKQQLTL